MPSDHTHQTEEADFGLPEPDCQLGYTQPQLALIFDFGLGAFQRWMRGQTIALCEGRLYDHDAKEYRMSGCGPHGAVVYPHDVRQYLAGGEPLD